MEDFGGIERRAARIKLLLMDCDGGLTDGQLMLLDNGAEQAPGYKFLSQAIKAGCRLAIKLTEKI